VHPNDDRFGVSHLWDVWNDKDYLAYRERTPRFAAEFGYQGPPVWATAVRGIGDAADGHQKAADGHAKLERGLADHFRTTGADLAPADRHFLTQLIQARAVRVGIGHLRAAQPVCMGAIWWQLNDCWAGPSWSVVDGDGRRKPAWYALRDAYRPRLLDLEPGDTGIELVAVNDTDEPWTGTATVTRFGFDGAELAAVTVEMACAPRSAQRWPLPAEVAKAEQPDRELVRAAFDGETADWFFRIDADLAYPTPRYTALCEPAPGGYVVQVEAQTLLRDLCLFPDRLDPESSVDTMLVTLLPGERARFEVRSSQPLDAAHLASASVLRCVNAVTLWHDGMPQHKEAGHP
jgi:beta-mannosidase